MKACKLCNVHCTYNKLNYIHTFTILLLVFKWNCCIASIAPLLPRVCVSSRVIIPSPWAWFAPPGRFLVGFRGVPSHLTYILVLKWYWTTDTAGLGSRNRMFLAARSRCRCKKKWQEPDKKTKKELQKSTGSPRPDSVIPRKTVEAPKYINQIMLTFSN